MHWVTIFTSRESGTERINATIVRLICVLVEGNGIPGCWKLNSLYKDRGHWFSYKNRVSPAPNLPVCRSRKFRFSSSARRFTLVRAILPCAHDFRNHHARYYHRKNIFITHIPVAIIGRVETMNYSDIVHSQ